MATSTRPAANATKRDVPLPDRLVSATHDVARLIEHFPHDQGCAQRYEQTSEFQCSCTRRQIYRDLQSTLRDAHAATTARTATGVANTADPSTTCGTA